MLKGNIAPMPVARYRYTRTISFAARDLRRDRRQSTNPSTFSVVHWMQQTQAYHRGEMTQYQKTYICQEIAALRVVGKLKSMGNGKLWAMALKQ